MFSEDNKILIEQLFNLIEERYQLTLGLSNLNQQMKYNGYVLSMDYKSYIEFSQTARLGQDYKIIQSRLMSIQNEELRRADLEWKLMNQFSRNLTLTMTERMLHLLIYYVGIFTNYVTTPSSCGNPPYNREAPKMISGLFFSPLRLLLIQNKIRPS